MTNGFKAMQTKRAPYRILSDEDLKKFYKLLITHNYSEASIQIGMDAYYNGKILRSIGSKIYKDIMDKGGPARLGFSPDTIEAVEAAIEKRKAVGNLGSKTEELPANEVTELLDPTDTKALVVGGRNKAAMLLHKKFDMLNKSKKALEDTSLSQLGTVFGIMFDKAQILQGQATENISVLSKNIDTNLTPEESLDMVLKAREKLVADKNK